jgi:hypothetical protein
MTVNRGTTRTTTLRSCTAVPDPRKAMSLLRSAQSLEGAKMPATRSSRRLARTWGHGSAWTSSDEAAVRTVDRDAGDPRGTPMRFSEGNRTAERIDNPLPLRAAA